jgi:predicted N-formylglutamate amidohydrolase
MTNFPSWSLLVTSEHGGNEVPAPYGPLFRGRGRELDSHLGWDPGTLSLARELAGRLGANLVTSTVTRLLVDLNRSPHNPRVFSRITRALPRAERMALLERFHQPHWEAARAAVDAGIARSGRVLHLGVHSFTPVLDGLTRRPDLALLYDPARPGELALASGWVKALEGVVPTRVVRRNDPYRGNADGLTTTLRKEYADSRYLGIEIEVNQRHVGRGNRFPTWVADALETTLAEALDRQPLAGVPPGK